MEYAYRMGSITFIFFPQAQITMNGSAQKTASLHRENHVSIPLPIPVSPPKIVPTTVNNNNISLISKEHTEEQLNNIKKYQVRCTKIIINDS